MMNQNIHKTIILTTLTSQLVLTLKSVQHEAFTMYGALIPSRFGRHGSINMEW